MPELPTSQEIISAVRNAGWLLEQDSAHALESHDFHTVIGWAYTDPEDATTSRELDVHGYRQFLRLEDEHKLLVSARVLIECKQTDGPFVLIGREAQDAVRQRHPTEHVLRYQRLLTGTTPIGDGRTRIESVPSWTHLGLSDLPGSPSGVKFRASQMTRLDRKKTWIADNRGIFSALVYPLAKALRAAQQRVKTTDMVITTPKRDAHEWTEVALNFPIIVTSAPLFIVDAGEEPIEPAQVNWATMTRHLKSRAIEGVFNIDVVNFASLDQYLTERVVRFASGVAQLAKASPGRFTSHETV